MTKVLLAPINSIGVKFNYLYADNQRYETALFFLLQLLYLKYLTFKDGNPFLGEHFIFCPCACSTLYPCLIGICTASVLISSF